MGFGQSKTMREIYIYILYRDNTTFQSPVVALMQHVLQETMHFLHSVFTSVLCMIRRVNTDYFPRQY
jgi:hypothetical protein